MQRQTTPVLIFLIPLIPVLQNKSGIGYPRNTQIEEISTHLQSVIKESPSY